MTSASRARRLVVLVLGAVTVVAGVLLAASFVPSAALASRLLAGVGEARGGAYGQELAANLDARLRFAAVVLLALLAGLLATRQALEDLVGAALGRWRALTWPGAWTLAEVGVPTLVAVAVRVPFLTQPIRYDEALSFNEFASRPLYYGLSFYPDPNNHVLNTLLVHVAWVAFGDAPWVLRLPALVSGVLLVPATYVLGRLLFGTGAGVLAAALVAVSSYLVEYSTNGRGYTLQALCLVALLVLVIVAARRDSPGALLAAALVGALGAYAVPTMLYGVAIAAAWFVVEQRRRHSTQIKGAHLVATVLAMGLAVALLYLPVVIVSGPDKLAFNRFVLPLSYAELASELPRTFASSWGLWNRDVPLVFAALLVVGFALGSRRVWLGLLAVGVCVAFVLLQRVAPFERVWLFLLPLYFVIASGGLARFVDGRWLAIVVGVGIGFFTLTSGSILRSTETGAYPDAEAVARALWPRLAPDDAVLTTLPTSLPELQYYFARIGLATNVLVRSPDDAQNLWVLAPPGVTPDIAGWQTPVEIERFASSSLYELKHQPTVR